MPCCTLIQKEIIINGINRCLCLFAMYVCLSGFCVLEFQSTAILDFILCSPILPTYTTSYLQPKISQSALFHLFLLGWGASFVEAFSSGLSVLVDFTTFSWDFCVLCFMLILSPFSSAQPYNYTHAVSFLFFYWVYLKSLLHAVKISICVGGTFLWLMF